MRAESRLVFPVFVIPVRLIVYRFILLSDVLYFRFHTPATFSLCILFELSAGREAVLRKVMTPPPRLMAV